MTKYRLEFFEGIGTDDVVDIELQNDAEAIAEAHRIAGELLQRGFLGDQVRSQWMIRVFRDEDQAVETIYVSDLVARY